VCDQRATVGPYRAVCDPIRTCPSCGGALQTDARRCRICSAALPVVRCNACFTLQRAGSAECSHCRRNLDGEAVFESTRDTPCPRCAQALESVAGAGMYECLPCGGLFVLHARLSAIVTERERARTGPPNEREAHAPRLSLESDVHYLKCPTCHAPMNRTNFGRRSGVVVDVCRGHGTWFDAGELTRALDFVAHGGLEIAKRMAKDHALDEARSKKFGRELAAALSVGHWQPTGGWRPGGPEVTWAEVEILLALLT
jgi:Zn-finger nucleic acid-binding protein